MSSQLKDVVIVIVIVIVVIIVVVVICSLFPTLRMGKKSVHLVCVICINYQWNGISLTYLSVSSRLLGYLALKVVQKYSSLNNGKLPSRYEKCTFKE